MCINFHQESAAKQLVFGVGIFMEHLANHFQIVPFNTFFVPYVLLYLSRFSNRDVKSWSTKSHSSGEGAWGANDGVFSFVLIYSW